MGIEHIGEYLGINIGEGFLQDNASVDADTAYSSPEAQQQPSQLPQTDRPSGQFNTMDGDHIRLGDEFVL